MTKWKRKKADILEREKGGGEPHYTTTTLFDFEKLTGLCCGDSMMWTVGIYSMQNLLCIKENDK